MYFGQTPQSVDYTTSMQGSRKRAVDLMLQADAMKRFNDPGRRQGIDRGFGQNVGVGQFPVPDFMMPGRQPGGATRTGLPYQQPGYAGGHQVRGMPSMPTIEPGVDDLIDQGGAMLQPQEGYSARANQMETGVPAPGMFPQGNVGARRSLDAGSAMPWIIKQLAKRNTYRPHWAR